MTIGFDTILADPDGFDPKELDAPPERSRWAVTDFGSAEWAMAKLAAAEERIEAARLHAEQLRDRVDAWFDSETRRDRRTVEFMGWHLQRYALAEREQTGEKTVRLPSGSVSTREYAAAVKLDDPEAFAAWVVEHALDADVWSDRVVKAAKAVKLARPVHDDDGCWLAVTADGERPAGLTVQPPRVVASISTIPAAAEPEPF